MTNDQRRDSDDRHRPEVGRPDDQPSSFLRRDFAKSEKNGFVGDFQMEILRAISVMGRSAFGTEIRNHLEKRLGRDVSTPQVFAALSRLSSLGLIVATADEAATAGRRGRPRRVYSLETSGLRMLKAGNILNPMSHQGNPHEVAATSNAGSLNPT